MLTCSLNKHGGLNTYDITKIVDGLSFNNKRWSDVNSVRSLILTLCQSLIIAFLNLISFLKYVTSKIMTEEIICKKSKKTEYSSQ